MQVAHGQAGTADIAIDGRTLRARPLCGGFPSALLSGAPASAINADQARTGIMMSRKALVGTSSPIGYDYRTKATKAKSDLSSSPNPILDSPFGILLFYDELWFFCRSLCPENMRELPYVHFVDEEIGIPENIGQLGWKELDALKDSEEWKGLVRSRRIIPGRDPFREGFGKYGVTWDNAIDNHTHGLSIGGIEANGNPTEDRLLFDLVLSKSLKLDGFELITNSYTHTMLESPRYSGVPSHEISEFMVVQDIPNYLSKMGPYHPVVDEARENQYLIDFRVWAAQAGKSTSIAELKEAKEAVERSIQETQDKLFLRYLDPKSFYKSLGKSVIGDGIGILIPGTSTATTVVEHMLERKEKNVIRWQGFLVSMRGKA